MTRDEAMADLPSGIGRFTIKAGFMFRGDIRSDALRAGINFYEERGFFNSTFVFRGDGLTLLSFRNFLTKKYKDNMR